MATMLSPGMTLCVRHDVQFAENGSCEVCTLNDLTNSATPNSAPPTATMLTRKMVNSPRHNITFRGGDYCDACADEAVDRRARDAERARVEARHIYAVTRKATGVAFEPGVASNPFVAISPPADRDAIVMHIRAYPPAAERETRRINDDLRRAALFDTFTRLQREGSPGQQAPELRAAASAEWSRRVREKVAASKARDAELERNQVVVDLDW